jgi:hypothetical protein
MIIEDVMIELDNIIKQAKENGVSLSDIADCLSCAGGKADASTVGVSAEMMITGPYADRCSLGSEWMKVADLASGSKLWCRCVGSTAPG